MEDFSTFDWRFEKLCGMEKSRILVIASKTKRNGQDLGGKLGRMYSKCAPESKDYAECIATHMNDINKGKCAKEFERFSKCLKENRRK